MKMNERRKEALDVNMTRAPDEDHLTRLIAIRQKAMLNSLIDELKEASRVKKVNSK